VAEETVATGLPAAGVVLGVGVDLVEVERVRRAVGRTPSLVGRVFTDAEERTATSGGDAAQRFAARFAAKEAVLKALGVGLGAVPLRDIEVVRAHGGAPSVALHGAARDLARRRGVGGWWVSLTHTGSAAAAVAVAVAGPVGPAPGGGR